MTSHSVSLDLSSALEAPSVCSACGANGLEAISSGDSVTFLCRRCQRAWQPELGAMVPLEADACPACRAGQACLVHHVVPSQRGST